MKARTKRIIVYRVVSIGSEYLIVLGVTGSYVYGLITTPLCIIVHTFLHWVIEKKIKENFKGGEK